MTHDTNPVSGEGITSLVTRSGGERSQVRESTRLHPRRNGPYSVRDDGQNHTPLDSRPRPPPRDEVFPSLNPEETSPPETGLQPRASPTQVGECPRSPTGSSVVHLCRQGVRLTWSFGTDIRPPRSLGEREIGSRGGDDDGGRVPPVPTWSSGGWVGSGTVPDPGVHT